MKSAATLLTTLCFVLSLQACYQSDPQENEDAITDPIPDTTTDDTADGTDTVTDDGVTDPITDDGVDVDPDVPPAQYRLHEWGVMVMDGDGASTHGPSPEFSGPIPAKPVLYLYADEVISPLSIAVSFASGASTEVWPDIPLGPQVVWNNLTLRPGPCATTPFPNPYGDDPWMDGMCEACNLSSCVVPGADCLDFTDAAGVATVSDLLFYTGRLPDYRAPLEAGVSVINDPTFVDRLEVSISNSTSRTVEDVWFIYRQTTDSCIDPSACPVISADIAWAYFDEVAGDSGFGTQLDVLRFEVELDEYGFPIGELELPREWLDLGKDLTAKLVERGLTSEEAGAFMRNWDTIFFGLMGSDSYYIEPFYRNGGALIYFMSDQDYNAQLPLTASPPPIETVRVGMIYENVPLAMP
jgi:hypothetical protein